MEDNWGVLALRLEINGAKSNRNLRSRPTRRSGESEGDGTVGKLSQSVQSETWIPYGLANGMNVQISIYDISGELVRQLDLGHQRAGHYTQRSRAAYWDGRNEVGEHVATGIYFYQLQADNTSLLRKMVILK